MKPTRNPNRAKEIIANVKNMLAKHKIEAGSIAARSATRAAIDHRPTNEFVDTKPKTFNPSSGAGMKVPMPKQTTNTPKAVAKKLGLEPGSVAYRAMMTAKKD